MKKQITNAKDSRCLDCFADECATVNAAGEVVCHQCGFSRIIDSTGEIFLPQFDYVNFYQASKYTPPLPCRRVDDRRWPLAKERRKDRKVQWSW